MNYLLIFPKEKQLQHLQNKVSSDDRIFHVSRDEEQQDYEMSKIPSDEIHVLPCNEEALYWLRMNRRPFFHYSFDEKYLNLLDKKSFKQYLLSAKINTAYIGCLSEVSRTSLSYPILLKPSIGFGSIGVKRINCEEELAEYLVQHQAIAATEIGSFSERYFQDIKNQIVVERVLNGRFFSVPFLVYQGRCVKLFLIEGRKTKHNCWTDFQWVEFLYKSSNQSGQVYHYCQQIADQIIDAFELETGVYMAEIICEQSGGVLVEFSPRQPGGRLNDLLYFSTGIDLDILSIEYLLENYEGIDFKGKAVDAKLCINDAENSAQRDVYNQPITYRITELN